MRAIVLILALCAPLAGARADVAPPHGDMSEGRERIMGLWALEKPLATGRDRRTSVLAIGNSEIARIDYTASIGVTEDGEEPYVPTAIDNFLLDGFSRRAYTVKSYDEKSVTIEFEHGGVQSLVIQTSEPNKLGIEEEIPRRYPPLPHEEKTAIYSYVRMIGWIPGMEEFSDGLWP